MTMHRHHIIPKHMGGTDDESNLTPPITIDQHAEEHRKLWERHGHVEDFIAWKALSGRISSEEARLLAAREGQKRSLKYKSSRPIAAQCLEKSYNRENCVRGGKTASKALTAWQRKNRKQFLKQCAINGKKKASTQWIPHRYKGVI